MAKATINGIIEGLSGSINKNPLRPHDGGGKTIISRKPNFSNRQFSEGQLNVHNGMKAAPAYAVVVKVNPVYVKKTEGTDNNAYIVAIGDWFNPPVIRRIESSAGNIRVVASDDVIF